MSSTYSPLLRLELMTVGEKTNTWGPIANRNFGTLLEKALAGAASVDVTSASVTLTTQSGQDDQARCAILSVFGTPGAQRNVIAPSTSKLYAVINASDAAIVVKGAATTGVTIAAGDLAWVVWDGSDFVRLTSSINAPLFTGIVTAAGFAGPLTGAVTGHASLDLPLTGGSLSGALAVPSGITLQNGYDAGFRDIPSVSVWTRGCCNVVSTTATFGPNNGAAVSAGYTYSVFNSAATPVSLIQGSDVTLHLSGTATTGSRTLAAKTMATLWCINAYSAVIAGAGVS